MKLLAPGTEIDGFRVGECIHAGGMAHIYAVEYAQAGRSPGFAMAMKIPRMTAGDGAENIVGFEVEQQIMPGLRGPHDPNLCTLQRGEQRLNATGQLRLLLGQSHG